jgi:UDP-GlcNAc:undecaprenyl-phosphate GlcNAc-1-phosphate transferase
VILWLWTALLSGLVLFPTYTNRGNAVVPLGIAALGLLLYVYFHPGVRSAREPALDDIPIPGEREGEGMPQSVVNLDDHRRTAERGGS